MTSTYFTFGQAHMTSFPLPRGGRLADFWVRVELPEGSWRDPREVFVEQFTSLYCPRPEQWGFEYTADRFDPRWFPGGELCVVGPEGVME